MSNYTLSKCRFIHIPKCGGTAINTALWRLGCVTSQEQALNEPNYGHLPIFNSPGPELPAFTFVRHPASWWMSFYHWNMNREHTRFSEQELKSPSFDYWIENYGPMWLGMYSTMVRRFCGFDPAYSMIFQVRMIGRTENLYADLKHILDFFEEPYKPNIMDAYINGHIKLDTKVTNKQFYDKTDISADSEKIIERTEAYVYERFNY